MKPFVKKLIIIGSIALAVLAGFAFDSIWAKSYQVTFATAERLSLDAIYDEDGNPVPKDVGISDGTTKMKMSLQLTHNGGGVSGHVLYIKTNRNVIGRMTTDKDGYINFQYDCYYSLEAKDVTFTADDENNSLFVYVPASGEYHLKMISPGSSSSSGMTTTDIFYEV